EAGEQGRLLQTPPDEQRDGNQGDGKEERYPPPPRLEGRVSHEIVCDADDANGDEEAHRRGRLDEAGPIPSSVIRCMLRDVDDGAEEVEVIPFDDRPRGGSSDNEPHLLSRFACKIAYGLPDPRRHDTPEHWRHLKGGCLQATTGVFVGRSNGLTGLLAAPPTHP